MTKTGKFALWVGGSIGVLVAVLLAIAILAPRFVDLDSIRRDVYDEIEHKIGVQAEFKLISLSLFPRPRIRLRDGTVSRSSQVIGSIERMTVYLRILPLLTGRKEVGGLDISAPLISLPVPAPPGSEEGTGGSGFSDIQARIVSALSRICSSEQGTSIRIRGGRLNLADAGGSSFNFERINASVTITSKGLEGKLSSKSNLWEGLSANLSFSPDAGAGKGRVTLSRFHPQLLTDFLFPSAPQRLGESLVDLDVNFNANGPRVFYADFKGSIPGLLLEREDVKVPVKGGKIAGSFSADSGKISLSLSRAELEQPRLQATGSFLLDPRAPSVKAELHGANVDAGALRDVALVLLKRYRGVRNTFNVVRGGDIPVITVTAQGSSTADLSKLKNYTIRGDMVNGIIYIPPVKLEVTNASGHALISDTILEATDLKGITVGSSTARDGYLKLGLKRRKGGDAPFNFNIELDADLAQLPPVLERAVKNEAFQRELALIKDVEGWASGRLILGDSRKHVETRVELGNLSLRCRYERMPYGVDVSGGPFVYAGTMVSDESLSGRIGKSTFSNVSATIDWEPEKSGIKVSTSAPAQIDLQQIHSWFTWYAGTRQAIKEISSIKGILDVSSLDLSGELFKPRDWRFEMKGGLRDVVAESSGWPGPFSVTSGGLEANQDGSKITDWRSGLLDATFVMSGKISGYPSRASLADLSFAGNIGPQANQWVGELFDIPRELRLRSPVSLAGVRLAWSREGGVDFSGDFSVQNGPRVSMDLEKNHDELSIKKLKINDDQSDVFLSFDLKNREFDLGFVGALSNSTVDHLLISNEFIQGRVQGDFHAHIVVDQPVKSMAEGNLRASGFTYAWKKFGPVKLDEIRVDAAGNRITVKSAGIEAFDKHFDLSGNVQFSDAGYLLDMDLAASGLDWEDINKLIDLKKNLGAQGESGRPMPINGTVDVKAGSFSYKSFTWKPVEAVVSLSPLGEDIEVTEAGLCGISTPMKIRVLPGEIQIDAKPHAKYVDINPTIACFWKKEGLVTGHFDLDGKLDAEAHTASLSWESLARELDGDLLFNALGGRIYRWTILSKIFSLINVTELYRGTLPDLTKEGLAYNSIRARGHLSDGKLQLRDSVIDGPSVKMVWSGEIDLVNDTVDLTVLVAPLKTIDSIIALIPFVNYVLGGALVSIPVKVTGEISDPTVVPLSPLAVGSELLGYMRRVLNLPFKVIQPLIKQ
jgi:hypothetical protein